MLEPDSPDEVADLNRANYPGAVARSAYRMMLRTRFLRPRRPHCQAIGVARSGRTIERIYVINLHRHTERWDRICGELSHVADCSGRPISGLARRVSAVDSREVWTAPRPASVEVSYSLADQLFVEPHPALGRSFDAESWAVEMTPQEVAVASSHIEVWKLVAAAECGYALILEDDVYFKRGFE